MINWPKFNLPPINLWSAPYQEIDYMREEINDIEKGISLSKLHIKQTTRFINFQESVRDIALLRLKNLEFIYYTRTGKFPK